MICLILVAVLVQVHAIHRVAHHVPQDVMVVLLRPAAHLAVLLVVVLALEHVRVLLLHQDAHLVVILVLERVLMTVNTDVSYLVQTIALAAVQEDVIEHAQVHVLHHVRVHVTHHVGTLAGALAA